MLMSEIKSLYAEAIVPIKHINASLETRKAQLSHLEYSLQARPAVVLGIAMICSSGAVKGCDAVWC